MSDRGTAVSGLENGPAASRAQRRNAGRPVISAQSLERLYFNNFMRQLIEINMALARRLRDLSMQDGHPGLKLSYASIIGHAGFGNIRLSDIAAMNGLSKQAVSQTARELCDLGYIRLVPDPADGRARIIVLTDRGSALVSDSLRSMDQVRAEAAALIGTEKMATLEAIVEELWTKLPQWEGEEKDGPAA